MHASLFAVCLPPHREAGILSLRIIAVEFINEATGQIINRANSRSLGE